MPDILEKWETKQKGIAVSRTWPLKSFFGCLYWCCHSGFRMGSRRVPYQRNLTERVKEEETFGSRAWIAAQAAPFGFEWNRFQNTDHIHFVKCRQNVDSEVFLLRDRLLPWAANWPRDSKRFRNHSLNSSTFRETWVNCSPGPTG